MKPDVGIVMPVYKQRKSYLHQAITTILNQTYRNFLFVIMIDGSTSEVVNQIRKSVNGDPRVVVLSRSKNKGIARSLNRGFNYLMKIPSIKFLTWVSSDNIHRPYFLKTLHSRIKKASPSVGLVYGTFERINGKGQVIHSRASARYLRKFQAQPKEKLLDSCFIGPAFLYKKSVAEKVGEYGLEPVEDYDYWLRLTEHCDIRYVPKQLIDYRVNSQHSVSLKLKKSRENYLRWRDALQKAKFLARQRRGIPVETSIIYPFQNVASTIDDDINAIFDQHYGNFELLLLDRGSSDGSYAKAVFYKDPRIRLIQAGSSKYPMDQLTAIKMGVHMSVGRFCFPIQHFKGYRHKFLYDLTNAFASGSDFYQLISSSDGVHLNPKPAFETGQDLYNRLYRRSYLSTIL